MMMNEKNRFNAPNDCGRKEDLVVYLYGEANASERASFERHLDDCDACRGELAAFGRVRDDLSAWQLGLAPRAEIVLRRSRFDVLRELIGMFPVWVRGATLAGAASAMLLVSLSIAGTRISLKDGDFAVNIGRKENAATGAPAVASEEVERMVQNAIAAEREKMEQRYSAQLASFKDQLNAESEAKLQAANAENQARLKTLQAALKQEMRRFNRQNTSIRSFFAMEDPNDPWRDGR
ncbi:MAG: zf-HC2 domain-containing protein [Blastocatellia bacterium]